MPTGLGLIIVALALTSPVGDDGDWERAIGQGYEANRTAFAFGTIRYRWARGEAADLDAAREGRWAWRTETEGYCVFDGKRGLYEHVFPLAEMVARRKVQYGKWLSPIESFRYLTDGDCTLFHVIVPDDAGRTNLHNSEIVAGSKSFHERMFLPLDLARPEPRRGLMTWIHRSEDGRPLKGVELVSAKEVGKAPDKNLVELKYQQFEKDGKGVACDVQIQVDLERGCVPVETQQVLHSKDKRYQQWTILEDLRKVEGKGWIPYRYLDHHDYDKSVIEFTILEADFDKPPPASAFRLEFDRPTKMYDQLRQVSYGPAKVFDLAKLPPIIPGSGPRGMGTGAQSPHLAGEQEPGRNWMPAVLSLGLVLLVGGGWMYRRRA